MTPLYHPADNGDAFGMTGSIVTTYQRPDATPDPEPTQTTLDAVTQTVTVTNPSTFAGNAKAVDFHTAETDQQTAPTQQTFKETVDNYFSFSNTYYEGNFLNLGYTSTDDSGYAVKYTFGTGNGLVDILPEASGASWTNTASATIATTSTDNESSSQSIASDGSYTETIQYQNVNGQGGLTDTATIHSNLDGSGLYQTPRLGTTFTSNYSYKVNPPTAAGPTGTITETTTIPAASSSSTPEPVSTTVPNWIPTGILGKALASETDTDKGKKTIPSSICPIASSFGTTANEIVQTKERVDPMFGELEGTTTTTYVIPNVGPACVTISDVQDNYYDFSGQNGAGYFSGTPQQITTLSETLYLTSEQLKSIARKPMLRNQIARTFAMRVSTAQARISIARIEQHTKLMHAFLHRTPGHGHTFSKSGRLF